MKPRTPAVFYASALALGMVAGASAMISWRSSVALPSPRLSFPAASQRMLGADQRIALPVLDAATTADDAALVDDWLQRADLNRLEEALPQIIGHPVPALRCRWLAAAFARWAALDHERALLRLENVQSYSLKRIALNAVMDATPSPEVLWVQSSKLRDPVLQRQMLQRYFTTGAASAPLLAAERAITVREPFSRYSAITTVVRRWSQTSPKECEAWAQHVSNAALRRIALQTLSEARAGKS
jgi:hypothetical protein